MTTPHEHAQFEFDAAPYALGALSVDDARAFEAHLAGCARCQAELADVRDLDARLAHADRAAFEAVPAVPETLLPRLLREVQRRRRVGSRRLWALSAVAACLAALLAVATVPRLFDQPDGRMSLHPVGASATAVHASVVLTPVGDTTNVELTCSYAASSTYSERTYQLVLTNRNGASVTWRPWTIRPGDTITIPGAAPWPRSQLGSISLQTGDGREILALNL